MAIGMSSVVGVRALRAGDAWTVWLFEIFEGALFWLPMVALLVVFPDGLAVQATRQRRVGMVVLLVAGVAAAFELFVTHVGLGDVPDAVLPSPLPVAFVPLWVTDDVTLPLALVALAVALAGLVALPHIARRGA